MATINAQKREIIGTGLGALRRSGSFPGILYGVGIEPLTLQMPTHESSLVLNRMTPDTVVEINVDGKIYNAVVKEIQRNKITGVPEHIDFKLV